MVRRPAAKATAGLRELQARPLDRRGTADPKRWGGNEKTPHHPSARKHGVKRRLCRSWGSRRWLPVTVYLQELSQRPDAPAL
ncbi:hypothetical protein D9M68_796870 [compost metagenome]